MATTTNYGWTTPDNTDLVKDGAAAIRTLGSAIDTSMNTALGTKKAGMVLLNTTSFSGVSSHTVNDVFSTTYDNYRILFNVTGSASASFLMRLRVAGVDLSTSVYTDQQLDASASAVGGARNVSQTAARLTFMDTSKSVGSCDLFSPFLAATKYHHSQSSRNTTSVIKYDLSCFINSAVSYTGATFITSSGTVTGEVSIYGYNK